jgi:16S rRNA (guanine1207-N2)-methyltransferase
VSRPRAKGHPAKTDPAKQPESRGSLAPRAAEQILIDALGDVLPGRILCTSLGRGQFAAAAARADASSSVCCSFLDLYALEQARLGQTDALSNLLLECRADFPDGPFDAVVFPVSTTGEAELVRDHLQSGHERLREGGIMLAAADNPDDNWLHGEMRKLFPKVTRRTVERGTLYKAIKAGPLKKLKNFECRFAFRDEGRLIQVISRPGVFSHRKIDGGARALLKAATIDPEQRVLELGCGSGVVSLAVALRAPDVHVLAVDSNPRAVECTEHGAQLNGISNLDVRLSTAESHTIPLSPCGRGARGEGGLAIPASDFDLVLANPPYYSNFRIAEVFAQCAARALKPAGIALFVTKRTDWYTENLPKWFVSVSTQPIGSYTIVRAQGPRSVPVDGLS